MNYIVDLLMDGSLKAEHFSPMEAVESRGLGLVKVGEKSGKVTFSIIFSLHGGNYIAANENPITLAIVDGIKSAKILNGDVVMTIADSQKLEDIAKALVQD